MNNLTTDQVKELLKSGKSVAAIATKYNISRQAVYYHTDKLKGKKRKPHGRYNYNREKQDYNALIDWRVYNEGLVKRGEILLDIDIFKEWDNELKMMNAGKLGHPYQYPESFILFLLRLKSMFEIDLRTMEGIARKLMLMIPGNRKAPDYSTLQVRLKRGRYALQVYEKPASGQTIAGDSSGLKTSNRGEYRMNQNKGKIKKKYVKVHISVNISNRQVVAEVVTDDGVSDNKKMKHLVKEAEIYGSVEKALFDKGYDGAENHWWLKQKAIVDGIKPRESLKLKRVREESKRLKEKIRLWQKKKKDTEKFQKHLHRLKLLRDYLKSKKGWSRKKGYGQRWHAEIRYSVFKRLFGDHVYSKTMECIKNEVMIKTNLMNLFTSFLRPQILI